MEVCVENGMSEYIPSLDARQKHKFLAEMQGTHKPVLPIHNAAEIELFRLLMEKNEDFNSPSGPIWSRAVKVWNYYANTNAGIFYKVCYDFTQFEIWVLED
jgi:hypothetical protein